MRDALMRRSSVFGGPRRVGMHHAARAAAAFSASSRPYVIAWRKELAEGEYPLTFGQQRVG